MTNTFAPAPTHFFKGKIGLPKKSRIAVIGAGAFGGWVSLYLLRSGFDVTLIDAWGAGNSRSSSGDETRVIRSTYGANEFYFSLNVRALELWKAHEKQWGKELFINSGVIWFCYQEKNPLVDDSIPYSEKYKSEYQYLSREEVIRKYPQVNADDLHHAWFDPHGGYLKAREACIAVNKAFFNEGGKFILANAVPTKGRSTTKLEGVTLSNGDKLTADVYLFACGSWLGQIFPEVLGKRIICTKQEVYYFGVPKEKSSLYNNMPVWVDLDGHDYYYGIPGNANRGFKVGVDLRGEIFDPTHGDRTYHPDTLLKARQFIGHRFPELKDAPLVESRVCPYENSTDGNFIFESHPEFSNVWFLGGGSGHGFKHGPALGELVANTF